MEGLRARVKCEPGLLLCSTAATALFGVGGEGKAQGTAVDASGSWVSQGYEGSLCLG